MPGHNAVPTIWVGPVRSHCTPIVIVLSAAACAATAPTRPNAKPVASAAALTVIVRIAFPPVLFVASIGKWPHPEVIADIAPQPVEAFRLDYEKNNNQQAKDDEPQLRHQIGDRRRRKDHPG